MVAAAMIGTAVIGGVAANSAANKAADSNKASTEAAGAATADRLAFDKQVYEDGKADRDWASANAKQMAQWQAEDRIKYNALQDDQIARGKKYQSAEDGMLADAQTYDTEAKREELVARARSDVQQGFASAEQQQTRQQQRLGLNPSSGRTMALSNQLTASKALGLASASTKARSDAETQGYARKMDAIGLGKGLVGNQATQAGLSLNSGNSSVQNGTVPLSIATTANTAMSNGYGNAAAGFGSRAGLQSANFYGAQQYGSGVGQGVGSFVGNLATRAMSGLPNTPSAGPGSAGWGMDLGQG